MPTRSELDAQAARDAETIGKLIASGSRPGARHTLEHHFVATDKASLDELIARAAGMGYRASAVERTEGETEEGPQLYYFVDILGDAVLEPVRVGVESGAMLALAEEFDVLYDGWGAAVSG